MKENKVKIVALIGVATLATNLLAPVVGCAIELEDTGEKIASAQQVSTDFSDRAIADVVEQEQEVEHSTDETSEFLVPDSELRASINASLYKDPNYAATKEELAGITSFVNVSGSSDGENKKIKSWEGLEYLTNLSELYVTNVETDVDLLNHVGEMTWLQTLDLNSIIFLGNDATMLNNVGENVGIQQVIDFSVLGNLTNLKYLHLGYLNCEMKNYTPYPRMKAELSGLSNLSQLHELVMTGIGETTDNGFGWLSSLENLEKLTVVSTSMDDVNSVSKLGNLTSLNVSDNHIRDYSPISDKNYFSDTSSNSYLLDPALMYEDDLLGSRLVNLNNIVTVGEEGGVGIEKAEIVPFSNVPNFTVISNTSSGTVLDGVIQMGELKSFNRYNWKTGVSDLYENDLNGTLVNYVVTLTNGKKISGYTYLNIYESTVTAKYVDQDGETIAADEVQSGNIGDDYVTEQKEVEGYIFKEVKGNPTGKFTDTSQTVTYVYTKESTEQTEAKPVTVKYQDVEGNELAPSTTLKGKVGLPYQTKPASVKGWALKETPSNATGIFTDEAQEVVFVYERTEAKPVTVKHQDEEGNKLAPSTTLSGKVGLPYQSAPASIDGWALRETPANANGIFTEESQEVVYVYERTGAKPVTVKYQDEEGNELVPSTTLNGELDLPYESTPASIDGWTLKETPLNAKGRFTKESQEVVYVYERTEAKPVTVKYQDEEGNELTSSITLNGKVGLPYESTPVSIDGWALKETPINAKGTFTKEPQEVVYVYKKEEGEVIVNHIDEDGNSIAPQEVIKGPIDSDYSSKGLKLLPQTGEHQNGILAITGMVLVSLFYLLFLKRKRDA